MHITADWFLTPTGCRAYADHLWDRMAAYERPSAAARLTRKVLLTLANAHERRGA